MVGAPLGSTETLMQAWISQGLGFCLSQIEQAFDKLFGLDGEPDEYTEFDTSALLRSAHKDRIDALARGIQGGVYSVNEARNMEGLDSVPFGQDVRLQAQNVPLCGGLDRCGSGSTSSASSTGNWQRRCRGLEL
jgi:hypothetical protein